MKMMFVYALCLIAAVSSAEQTEPEAASYFRTLEPGQCYTWGLDSQLTLPLESGRIITEAVLRVHNIRSGTSDSSSMPRSSLRPGPSLESPDSPEPFDGTLRLYLLDNPQHGFLPLSLSQGDRFARFGSVLAAEYEQGDLVFRLSRTHDPNNWTAKVFGDDVSLALADGTSVLLSSSLLEFIDYAGTGSSVGFGIYGGEVCYTYDDITLLVTVQSYQGGLPPEMVLFRITDADLPEYIYTLVTTSVNGSVTRSPDKLTYRWGETVTLTATADVGYTFFGWSGGITDTANPLTITMDSSTTIKAVFTENSRSSQRGT